MLLSEQGPKPSLIRNLAGWGMLATTSSAFVICSLLLPPRRLLLPLKAMLRFAFRLFGLRVRIVGIERLDPARTYIYMFNHTNVLDHLILLAYLPGYFVGLEAIEAERIPIYGWAGRRWGQIRIDRNSPEAARRSCDEVVKRLAAGTNVAICPEGKHTRDGTMGPFKKGGFHVAVDAQATIVPMAFRGLFRLMPHPRKTVAAGDLEIRIGEPVSPPSPGVDAVEALLETTRARIAEELAAAA